MGFYSGKSYIKVDGQKEVTMNKPVLEYTSPKTVAIPLKNAGYEDFEIHVEVGTPVKIGTLLATGKDHNKLPLFSSVSGTVTAIEKRDHISLKKTNHIVIENDFKDEKETLFEPLSDISSLTDAEIKDHLKNAGVLGLGGLGVQTFTKFRNTKNVDTIMINGVETDTYVTADETNMLNDAELLIDGAKALLKAADAKVCIIVVTETKKAIIDKLNSLISGTNIEIKTMPDVYPTGFERSLIKKFFNKEYKFMSLEVGIISVNVSTVIEFARTLKNGLPLYERVITLGGDGFANPQNVKVRVGTLLTDILSEIGGYTDGVSKETARLAHGGPMRGDAVITDNLSVTPITAGFTCMLANYQESPCSRCGECIRHCPADIQPIQILRAFKLKDKPALLDLSADKCIECGVCSYVCPSFIDVADGAKKGRALALQKN